MFSFKNKTEKIAQQPAIHEVFGCCGKLPLHADFIKHNLKVRESVALDDWIQDGVTLLNRRYEEKWKKVFQLSPNFRFVFCGDENDKTITGVISPSTDKIGRSYPFVVFRASDNPTIKKHQSLAPLAFFDTYRSIDQLLAKPWKNEQLIDLLGTVDQFGAQQHNLSDTDWTERLFSILENTTIGDIWDEILPGADENLRVSFMHVVMSSLQTVARRSPHKVHWGLRFPLPSDVSAIKHIVFWLQLSKSAIGDRTWRAHFIWNPAAPGIPARLLLFFHQIPASYFTLLVEPRRTDDTVMDVLQEIETINADPAQLTKYHFPSDMSLQEVIDEVSNLAVS